jgi:hypothetical protein
MNRYKAGGLLLAAALAVSALAAATASATPEFLTKTVVAEGVKIPIVGTLGAAFLEGEVSKTKIECSAGTATGEVTGPTRTKGNKTTFTGCKTGSFICTSAGEAEGVIKTKTLEGELGDVKAGLPGMRLFDEASGKGGVLAEFSCAGGAVAVTVKGSVIGQLSGAKGTNAETGHLVATHKLTFAEKEGHQKWVKFLGEAGTEQLESKTGEGEYEKAGQSVIVALRTEPKTWEIGVTK